MSELPPLPAARPRPPLDVLPAGVPQRIAAHPIPFDAVRGMHRDGRITARLRDELLAWLGAMDHRIKDAS